MDRFQHFNLSRTPNYCGGVTLSSDGSWKFSSGSDTPPPKIYLANTDTPPTKIRSANTDIVVTRRIDTIDKPIDYAHAISPTVNGRAEDTDGEDTDGEDTDTTEPWTKRAWPSSDRLLSPSRSLAPSLAAQYSDDDVTSVELLSSIGGDGDEVYRRQAAVKVDVGVQVDVAVQVNVVKQQVRAAMVKKFQSGDGNFLRKGVGKYQSGNGYHGTSLATVTAGTNNRYKPAKVAGNKTRQIINAYTSNAYKVSMKPATFQYSSSSYINRQANQREIDRKNNIMVNKLLNVKATVLTFR